MDGEHYPPVIESALAELAAEGDEICAAFLLGGTEKLPEGGLSSLGGTRVITALDPLRELPRALVELDVDEVVDLSDEPVLDYRRRFELAALTLWRGVGYRGADFSFVPPPRPHLCAKPSVAVIGTGKRTGKTAIAAHAARALVDRGHQPVMVAMGRGGPSEPEVLRGDELTLGPTELLEFAEEGKHAASDYIEDAVLARVPTVGCRRCGGGLAGGVEHSNVGAGIELANDLPGDLILLEGSGSAIPPAHADATVLVVPAGIPDEYLYGYMGPYRLLLSDLVVVTMCEEPFGSLSQVSSLSSHIRTSLGSTQREESGGRMAVVRTVFRPAPTRSIDGATAVVATTAPEAAGDSIKSHLRSLGCDVAAISHSLSDRTRLKKELEAGRKEADILLCEIKAAGIDVATRWGLENDLDVVYMDNAPQAVGGDDLDGALHEVAQLAIERFS